MRSGRRFEGAICSRMLPAHPRILCLHRRRRRNPLRCESLRPLRSLRWVRKMSHL